MPKAPSLVFINLEGIWRHIYHRYTEMNGKISPAVSAFYLIQCLVDLKAKTTTQFRAKKQGTKEWEWKENITATWFLMPVKGKML